MHEQATAFTIFVKNVLSSAFVDKRVLDVGSGDINGNNRFLFTNCDYAGNDVAEGPNVTIVSKTKDLPFPPATFDTIVSTECFEHDPEYAQSLLRIYDMLKPGGVFVFTCASTNRPEHGTRRTSPSDSLGTRGQLVDMQDYYKNLEIQDINAVAPLHTVFAAWDSYYNGTTRDLYFVGVKRGDSGSGSGNGSEAILFPSYTAPGTVKTTLSPSRGTLTLTEAFDRHATDKGSWFHNYGKYYERYMLPFKTRPIRYLEIGVFRGASLRAMRDYFVNATVVVGIDNNPDARLYQDPSKSMFVEIGSQSDAAFLARVNEQYGPFDIILDDGSHQLADMRASFGILFPLLSNGGLYVVEDTICIRDHLSFFTSGIGRHLNKWRRDETPPGDHCVDPAKINIKTRDPLEYSMGDIVITNSAILVHKDVKAHWIA